MSDVHGCLDCLQLALLVVNEKPLGCKSPHDWLMMLSVDLVTFGGISLEHKWKGDYSLVVLVKRLSKMADNSTSKPLKSTSIESSCITTDLWRIA